MLFVYNFQSWKVYPTTYWLCLLVSKDENPFISLFLSFLTCKMK